MGAELETGAAVFREANQRAARTQRPPAQASVFPCFRKGTACKTRDLSQGNGSGTWAGAPIETFCNESSLLRPFLRPVCPPSVCHRREMESEYDGETYEKIRPAL